MDKRAKPEEVITKLREIEIRLARGETVDLRIFWIILVLSIVDRFTGLG